MALLTTFCQRCARIALADERGAEQGRLACSSCGASVAILPGCSFTHDDASLFDDLLQVVVEANLTPDLIRQIAFEVAQTLRARGDTGPLLERLTVPLPGLVPLQIATGRNETARRQALRVLRAVLEAKGLEGR
jgi:hypothetical protein